MSPAEPFRELFILSPPHSGTTVMAKLLLSSPRIWARIDNAEGQKLAESAPFMPANPWNRRIPADWPSLKAIWEEGRPEGAIFLEKSPPNMARVDGILAHWPAAFFVISMRNPFALIASYLQRRGATEDQVRASAHRWVIRSRMQRENIKRLKTRTLITTYESFTARPKKLIRQLERVFGPLSVQAGRELQVKNYESAPISDHNARQIATMSPEHLELARALLQAEAAEDMAFWGY